MTRRRISQEGYEALARSMAGRIKPGTIKGRMADGLPVDEEKHF
jgi:hypothetical protein